MKLTITILGTGTSQGVPVVACDCFVCQSSDSKDKRLRTSALIEAPDKNILIDAGPDFRQQMLREKVKKLDAILITHDHKDHIGGIDDIRAFNWINQQPMDIYGNRNTLNTIKKDFSYAFEEHKYPGVPEINLLEINGSPFNIGNTVILPINAMHGRLPVLGFRIGDFSYLTDASIIEASELQKMLGSKVIVINGLRKVKHHSHFTLSEAIEIIRKISPEKAYITHISHQMGLHQQVNTDLPERIELGFDGLKIEI